MTDLSLWQAIVLFVILTTAIAWWMIIKDENSAKDEESYDAFDDNVGDHDDTN